MAAPPAYGPAGGDEDPDRRAPEPEGLVEHEAVPWEPVVTRPDWMTEEEQQALLDAVTDDDAPWWLEEGDPDPEEDPPPEEYDLEQVIAECRQAAEDQASAAANAARLGATGALGAIAAGRRGPGQSGSARRFAGEYPSRAAQFATGMLMDTMPGRPELAGFAGEAVGADDRFDGASDDEVLGVLCAWDRVEAHAAARKHAAVAELIGRRHGAEYLYLLVLRIIGAGTDRRVHRDRGEDLKQVVLGHDVQPPARKPVPGREVPDTPGVRGVPRARDPQAGPEPDVAVSVVFTEQDLFRSGLMALALRGQRSDLGVAQPRIRPLQIGSLRDVLARLADPGRIGPADSPP